MHVIESPMIFEKTPCVVTRQTTELWTEIQRKLAEGSPVAKDLGQLKKLVHPVLQCPVIIC